MHQRPSTANFGIYLFERRISMQKETRKPDIVQKYFLRKEDGEIDYSHPYDLITGTKNHKNLYCVQLDGQIGYIDLKGNVVVSPYYDFTRFNYNGEQTFNESQWSFYGSKSMIIPVYKNNGVGVINDSGEEIVPCEFEDAKTSELDASEDFIPIALPSSDNSKLVWGMYDVKDKRVSVTPQYEDLKKEHYGYASFRQNYRWGLVHCATGIEVIPAIYLLELSMSSTGIILAYLGGTYNWHDLFTPEGCHVLVLNGIMQAPIVLSGYDRIQCTGPSVMECCIGSDQNPKQKDSFKILKMPNYIAIVKNASYEAGYFLARSGEFVKEWSTNCTMHNKLPHARYVSGGIFSAKTHDGIDIPVTTEMKEEILKCIREE